ncbi:cyclase family protein [Mycolicibacterium agri]|uniref:Cyclase n=1 Tax=Mycolicibacterium agri TaxID=36811 RepID=A0A7I9W5M5_MYCAG|nr:cyclase family protein [Mycolicibacterium agri]GFG52687.1 cyclase [Mycolicibacterium agri]
MLLDVSQPLHTGMPKAAPLSDVRVEPVLRIKDGDALDTSELSMPSHAGTHVDAPSHAIDGGATIDEIPTDRFLGPAVVSAVRCEPGEVIGISHVLDGGPEPTAGDMLFLDTGWGARFFDDSYYDHPSLEPELAQWLVDKGVKLLAVDMITPDLAHARRSEGFDYPVHKILLGNDVLIAENLSDMSAFAGRRVFAYAFPLIVRGGDAGHARIVLSDEPVG